MNRYLMHSSGRTVPFTFLLLWWKAACCVTTCVSGCYLWGVLCNTCGAHSVSLAGRVGSRKSRDLGFFPDSATYACSETKKKKSRRGGKAILGIWLCNEICKVFILFCCGLVWFWIFLLSHCPPFKIEILSVLFAFPGNNHIKTEYQI